MCVFCLSVNKHFIIKRVVLHWVHKFANYDVTQDAVNDASDMQHNDLQDENLMNESELTDSSDV